MPSMNTKAMLCTVSLATASVLAMSNTASAQNWEADSQLRFGAFLQGGRTSFSNTLGVNNGPANVVTGSDSRDISNNGFGLTAGAEMLRWSGWTFGVEGDYGVKGANNADLVGTRVQGDVFGSVRGRIGYYVRRDWVLYGTGGIGFQGVSVTDVNGGKGEHTLWGGVYGGGSEWHFGNTILFAEYLHQNYDNSSVNVTGTSLLSTYANSYAVSGSSDAVRLGVKFKLGFDNYTDDVRDGLRR